MPLDMFEKEVAQSLHLGKPDGHVGSRFDVQAAEQTATPIAVRAGGRVLPQIAVLNR